VQKRLAHGFGAVRRIGNIGTTARLPPSRFVNAMRTQFTSMIGSARFRPRFLLARSA